MADPLISLRRTKGAEGLWSNDPTDPGGETVLGQTRSAEPEAPVWAIVDRLKKEPGFPKNLDCKEVRDAVDLFYLAKYAAPVRLAEIPDQDIANELFDTAVNISPYFSVVFLQLTLNPLNKRGKLFADVPVTGDMVGNNLTLDALRACLACRKEAVGVIWKGLNAWQDVYYMCGGKDNFKKIMQAMKDSPPPDWREDFEWGWQINRAFEPDVAHRLFGG